ncbi:tRNA (adenosine(37)-N6)-threonylcarbamoyltransferase complex dimerization subunit type 1 TsaB [Persicirhabdus sediminis]|uniref:tRNA (Adenosine(37)-N6)-threonylcarbamoyltransferase complex dimerization subunit type 1 TsaB n=1 Tax=Persicirhabdus sediminis TaxID=454144 RepID=A0A8J7MG15_9BACT|nr:tRNA (adenosine(37)-N6)-threonylcarbamoyltransferase complex dimerization subunit type 1 TsaB [Persicirhabdus sediminis]MBK1792083.1 tRNA (adenosine(37)-N6)-threonylcarbamoyltransferase complex dimerization subunit type 1 TsaB [Persicirhabdus sediminis]
MDTIISIECSTSRASIALTSGSECLFQQEFLNDRYHHAEIFDALKKALECLPVGHGLDCVLIGLGPGSYSSIRIGIATGQSLAIVHRCPAIGMSSLLASETALESANTLAVGDARRGSYFISQINQRTMPEPELVDTDTFLQTLQAAKESNQPIFSCDEKWPMPLESELAESITHEHPQALGLIKQWQLLDEEQRSQLQAMPTSPIYLRPPFTSEAKKGHPLLRKK